MVSRPALSGTVFVFSVFTFCCLCFIKQAAFASPQYVEITLTNPSKPGIKIRVDQAYLPSTFLGLVRENRKGGEHKMAMLDVSYPSMSPIESDDANSDQWKGIVLLRNSNDNFVNNYFKTRIGKRFKEKTILYGDLQMFVLTDVSNMHINAIKVQSDDEIYYYESNKMDKKYLITCHYTSLIKSKCSGFFQLRSGLMFEFQIPHEQLSNWREIYSKYEIFSEQFHALGE